MSPRWDFQTSSRQIKFVWQRRQMTSGGEARKSGLSQRFCQRVFPVVNTPTEGRAPPDYLTWNRHRNDRIAQQADVARWFGEWDKSAPLLPFAFAPVRQEGARNGHPPITWRTDQIDPEHAKSARGNFG